MLAKAGGKSLPLGPTGNGNSPYQPLSSFAERVGERPQPSA
jgi:hypothetical protein